MNKVVKFLIRQTYSGLNVKFDMNNSVLKNMEFYEFLCEAGMFKQNKFFEYFSPEEKLEAKQRYLDAISASVQGTATIVLKRSVKDIFINPTIN